MPMLYAICDDQGKEQEIFKKHENADKCMCLEYDNDPQYSIKEIEAEKDRKTDDKEYSRIPYEFFAVKVGGEILKAYKNEDKADTFAYEYNERAENDARDVLDMPDDDLSEKDMAELAYQRGYDSGVAKVKRIKPSKGEDYNDCYRLWKK
ncbi:hypothetical protein PUW24_16285 [Paenibacillus urinalis]|uniref:DUF4288 domain-containing protein n=1 Tax=Paenibacillus urinalis TaxID=521520 RepID=A0ABY7XGT1_9BACL|nr:hypothetical protein [Paenibacillus urinalis]WDH95759.1 hypothetical protein PUW24_16285 [Paenibacillus urinalis]WDI03956.1 hypothetical protein PUW25_08405 [Paenibacillus urinalis]